MTTIRFRNNTYTFDNCDLNLQYFDSGDLHGNDNFRIPDQNPPVYEVLNQIDPTLMQSAMAAVIDGKTVPLTEKITKDCVLDIVTLEENEGKQIYHDSLAFLIAQTAFACNTEWQLAAITVSDENCTLQFTSNAQMPEYTAIKQQLTETIQNTAAIQIITGFQKEMLTETYASLSQPYAQTLLAQYDDYDFVPIAARQNFVLPITEKTVLVTNPSVIKEYTITLQYTDDGFTVVCQHSIA